MDDISDFLSLLLAAGKSGSWMYIVAAILMFAVWGARKYFADRIPWLKSDAGGVVAAFVLSFLGALVTAIGVAVTGGTSVSWGALGVLALASLKVALAAMGGWSGLKKAALPLLTWLLGKLGIGAAKIAAAEKSGADAVKANPAPGASGPAGSPTEIP